MPKWTNNEAIKPIRSIMLRTLNAEARKHGTQFTGRFQLSQTSVNILYVVIWASEPSPPSVANRVKVHNIFTISQVCLTSHPQSTLVLLHTGTPGTSRENYSQLRVRVTSSAGLRLLTHVGFFSKTGFDTFRSVPIYGKDQEDLTVETCFLRYREI